MIPVIATNIRKKRVQETTLRRCFENYDTLMFSQLIYPGSGLCEIYIFLPSSVKCFERSPGRMTVFSTLILSSSVKNEMMALYALRFSLAIWCFSLCFSWIISAYIVFTFSFLYFLSIFNLSTCSSALSSIPSSFFPFSLNYLIFFLMPPSLWSSFFFFASIDNNY